MKKKNIFAKYMLPVVLLGVFMLVIYGAYTPPQKAEIQRIVCIKFKQGTTPAEVEKHMKEFAGLRRDVYDVVGYSAGKVLSTDNANYDVVHYLTFRNTAGIAAYEKNPDRLAFVAANKGHWENVWEIDSGIEK